MRLKKITQHELDQILDEHELWWETKKIEGRRADLSYCDLSDLVIAQRRIRNLSITGSVLDKLIIKGSSLECVDISESMLKNLSIDGSKFHYCRVSESEMSNVKSQRSYFELCAFKKSKLNRIYSEMCFLVEIEHRDTTISGFESKRCKLESIHLKSMKCEDIFLEQSALYDLDVWNSRFENIRIIDGDCFVTDLDKVNISGLCVEHTSLEGFRLNETSVDHDKWKDSVVFNLNTYAFDKITSFEELKGRDTIIKTPGLQNSQKEVYSYMAKLKTNDKDQR